MMCFRPLPGSFLFHPDVKHYEQNKQRSFRPLPGSFLFHQFKYDFNVHSDGFPSPAGVFFISSLLQSENDTQYCVASFRPLPESFLFHHLEHFRLLLFCVVSVPCRGLFYFIQKMKVSVYYERKNSFRPLPGSFLFHRITDDDNTGFQLVSVPCRGLFYFIKKGMINMYESKRVSVPCRGLFYFIPVPDIPVYIRGYQLICGIKI